MTQDQIKEVLARHQHWIKEDCDGWQNMKADLRSANLYGADLRSADLYGADLRSADLRSANLYGANLYGADLRSADLRSADLRGADLRSANLRSANLRSADLRSADLRSANLLSADLRGAKNIPFIPYTCPDFGSFIGFKKAQGMIVVLEIPEDAKRLSATGRKCRCDKAKVLGIQNIDGTRSNLTKVVSDRTDDFVYKVGEIVSVDDFDENRWNECSTGIHFFINRQEAVEYV